MCFIGFINNKKNLFFLKFQRPISFTLFHGHFQFMANKNESLHFFCFTRELVFIWPNKLVVFVELRIQMANADEQTHSSVYKSIKNLLNGVTEPEYF